MPLKIKYQNIKLLQQQYRNFSFSRKFEQEIVDFDPIDDHRDARYRVRSVTSYNGQSKAKRGVKRLYCPLRNVRRGRQR